MPRYKVDKTGFYEGRLYDPEGKRKFLDTDLPFTKKWPMPSWVSKMPEESEALKAKREAKDKLEKEIAEIAEDKAKQDREDIARAASTGDGKEASFFDSVKNVVTGGSGKVETL